jgi:hypothetical protein
MGCLDGDGVLDTRMFECMETFLHGLCTVSVLDECIYSRRLLLHMFWRALKWWLGLRRVSSKTLASWSLILKTSRQTLVLYKDRGDRYDHVFAC